MWIHELPTHNKVGKLDCLYASISCVLNTLCFPALLCLGTGDYCFKGGDCDDFRMFACCCCSGKSLKGGDRDHWHGDYSATRNAPETCMMFLKTCCGSDATAPTQAEMTPFTSTTQRDSILIYQMT